MLDLLEIVHNAGYVFVDIYPGNIALIKATNSPPNTNTALLQQQVNILRKNKYSMNHFVGNQIIFNDIMSLTPYIDYATGKHVKQHDD